MLLKKKNGDIKKLLNSNEKIFFIKRLNELINHGYTLEDSIEFILLQYNADKTILDKLKYELSTGKKLSDILLYLNYSSIVVSKMKFAENYGRISNILTEIENYLLIKKEQKEKIINTIRYPLFLTTTLIALLIMFNMLVIPQFQSIYTSSNLPMDRQVAILITILYYLPKFLTVLIAFLIVITIYILYLYKYKKNTFLKTILNIPFLNSYFKYYFSYQYSLELSLFLKSGFSIKIALEEIIEKNYDYFFTEFSKQINNQLIIGKSFEESVRNINYFDENMYKFIIHGRKNSMLDKELKLFSDIMLDSFIKLIDSRLKKIQPILFLFLALIIVGLYLVILLPIFNMTSAIK
ncbi:competence type IV pilus assembly protein ComGB [Gemelliphila palaticanis]|uniref:competence type IV pilus assembly protein ComGB n=1 Tax=Gemelliphila palaticanis TaxID=81950 RepID=UPI001D1613FA|nr:competence type IV pilus assembly protein ComGB [Gemella palaticanis]